MKKWLVGVPGRLTWSQRFMLASLMILVVGMAGIGWWVGRQIEDGVVHQIALNTALYVSSIVEPNLQELADGDRILPEHAAMLTRLLQENGLGQKITTVKVWDKQGRVVYATDPGAQGLVFPIDASLARALRGWVASEISVLDEPENQFDRDRGVRRLETYSPVRRAGSDQVIAAVEFYQAVDSLERDIAAAQRNSWLVVGIVTIGMYLLLAGFVRYASDTMQRQHSANLQLHDRVRRAARRGAALNERFLRRISAELHDGPAQDLGVALLRLEQLQPKTESVSGNGNAHSNGHADFRLIKTSLLHALQEIRAISAGLGLPELENVSLAEAVTRAVRTHERRTGTDVTLTLSPLPDYALLSVKITVYRIVQEALTNAYRHANGSDQRVQVSFARHQLNVIVSDGGPGFDNTQAAEWDEHLGLVGMRERVESLGGVFRIESQAGQGTRVMAYLPLDAA